MIGAEGEVRTQAAAAAPAVDASKFRVAGRGFGRIPLLFGDVGKGECDQKRRRGARGGSAGYR